MIVGTIQPSAGPFRALYLEAAMMDSVFTTLCGVLFITCVVPFVRCQPAEEKSDQWLEVLKNDPRLKVAVNLKFTSRPNATDVFETLQKATGVPLSLADREEKGTATFGATTVSGVPAWKVMEILASTQVTDGKWVKAGDGYVLHGTPKDAGMAVATPEAAKEQAAKTKAHDEQIAKAHKAVADFAKFHPLGADTKLRSRLAVVEKHPKLKDMLGRLATCTGLSFSVADNLTHHDPDLGYIDLKNTTAYAIMEIIAERDLDNGRWEKIDGCYRLEGVSRILPPPSRFPWLWTAIGLSAALAPAAAFTIYRRRRKPAAMVPS
jgi:hypothetical protein